MAEIPSGQSLTRITRDPRRPSPGTGQQEGNRQNQRLPRLRDTLGPQLILPRPSLRPKSNLPPPLYVPGLSQLYLDDLPIFIYNICGSHYNMTQPQNETKASHARYTVDRREIRYTLEVVQQPEKARACGSGPRSSADRRPVDPPPVVELRVFANDVDVTMSYDATFMLYASLEVARPIAAGKLHTPQSIPVLTGVAVASAAYLDRPKPAAYFIFPDLSVRHEGWYRLKFSLFEGVKHEADADIGKPFVRAATSTSKYMPPVRHESMANRLEVQSVPFQVWSAKKFPGLAMSTNLSKLVAEQGCRVRIRRDIRQRKRQTKGEPDGEDVHSSYHNTPQPVYQSLDHSRSASRNSIGSHYEADAARRASVESVYRQPAIQSRHGSIVGIPLMSPGLPTPTQSMPPPPPHAYPQGSLSRPPLESSPVTAHTPSQLVAPPSFGPPPSLRSEPRPSFSADLDSKLPPIQNLPRPLYDLPETHPAKRLASSCSYDSETALKDRERPDARRFATPQSRHYWSPEISVDGANQFIEADTGDDGDSDLIALEGPMIYERANGSKASKQNRAL